MSKSFALPIAACLALTGCQMFHKSPTWAKVVGTRIAFPPTQDNSKAYADRLHDELKADGVAHKVVTYQYRSRTRPREEVMSERTAVIYRDDTKPDHPYWLKDETSGRPLWLPNGSAEQQIKFYVGRDVHIVDAGEMRGGEGKGVVHASGRRHAQTPTPPDALDADAAFRRMHGTAFNPASAVDREKMNTLLQTRNAVASASAF